MSAIAGPSRLPYIATRQISPLIRTYATPADPSYAKESDITLNRTHVDEDTLSRMDRDDKRDALRDKKIWATLKGYQTWLKSDGREFSSAGNGKARWLGRTHPYPANPTFKPPPPLGNNLQEIIYREIKRGTKSVATISSEYSVSKARVDAIRKLKAVEEEMKRQDLPLQRAFQEGMEPLLGATSGSNPRSGYSEQAQRDATLERESHPSTAVERDEEHRLEAGVGEGGAFGSRETKELGIERQVWEFRDEDAVISAKAKPIEREVADADTPQQLAQELEHDPFPTPQTVAKASQLAKRNTAKSTANEMIVGDIRFVDVSSDKPSGQNWIVAKRAARRDKAKGRI